MRVIRLAAVGSLISLLIPIVAWASPQLEVEIGLSGRFLVGRFTQARVVVHSVKSPFSGSFLFTQSVGTPWRGEASSRTQVAYPAIGDGTYEFLLPIYDATSPLSVLLCAQDGTPVATAQLDLRQGKQDEAFTVLVGSGDALSSAGVAIEEADLPSLWLAYEGVRALWIGQIPRPPSQAQWEAIARWVLAGGTLVLFSGPDFYLFDSPLVRDLLPIDAPLVDRDAGVLRGTPRSQTLTLLTAQDGPPLLYSHHYGLGTVLLAAVTQHRRPPSSCAPWTRRSPPPPSYPLRERAPIFSRTCRSTTRTTRWPCCSSPPACSELRSSSPASNASGPDCYCSWGSLPALQFHAV